MSLMNKLKSNKAIHRLFFIKTFNMIVIYYFQLLYVYIELCLIIISCAKYSIIVI